MDRQSPDPPADSSPSTVATPRRAPFPITANGCGQVVPKDDPAERSRRGIFGSGQAHFRMAGDREAPAPREL